MKKKTRCFIALDLPRVAIKEIVRIQKLIKNNNLFMGKFTEPEHIHLTLKFLGEIDDEKIEEVKKRLSDIDLNGFVSKFGRVGVFNKRFVRIVWIELLGKEVLKLQKVVDEKLSGVFEKEARFMSHITIARVKHVPNKKRLFEYLEGIKPAGIDFKVSEFVFRKSELLLEGPKYTDIKKYNLV